ncbi:exosome complex component RRP43 isoform X2 [Synchiropus splendidus]|uniref:exosome complex component RRP43 isoform X2 n=1 Tax=Synchiropus splendidus TaxID=270530 RepID=UPI00237DF1F6|nr:exosome complex component RRP43 isoform X2 [Synchiropus splendidus]
MELHFLNVICFPPAMSHAYHFFNLIQDCRASRVPQNLPERKLSTRRTGPVRVQNHDIKHRIDIHCRRLRARESGKHDRHMWNQSGRRPLDQVPNVDLPPLCSSQFRPGPPGEQAQAASQFMADIIESSEVILMEDLCIERGKLCWVLYCDLLCLDYDGNLLDACVIALLAALKNTRIPEVSVNKETSSPEVDSKKKRGLKIQRCPIATSFTVFDNSIVIADPTLEEECLSTAQLTVVTDEDDQLCSLHKPGGTSLSGQKLQECINAATTRHEEIQKLMDKVFNSVKPPQ